jgi:MYXO-CTERM domain-containing protein
MNSRRRLGRILVLSVAYATGSAAFADSLAPNGIVVGPRGTTALADTHLAGTVVEDVVTPFSYVGWFRDSEIEDGYTTGNVTGSVQSRVVRGLDDTYDFYWRIVVDDTSFLPVLSMHLTGLAPGTYNADFRLDGPGTVQPAFAEQHHNGSVTWAFGEFIPPSTQVFPGLESRFLFLDSTARTYAPSAFLSLESGRDTGGSMMIQWGGESTAYPAFGPTPVPEPSAGWLALVGLAALALRRRRA